ncbi:MAG: phosphatidate cytidylyltransferase [Planctomycetota bacterium]
MRPELRNRLIFGHLLAGLFVICLGVDLTTGHHWGILGLLTVAVLLAGLELRSLSIHVQALIPVGPLLVCSELLLLFYFLAYDSSYGAPWLPASVRALPVPALIIAGGFMWMCFVHMGRKGYQDFTRYVGMGMLCLGYLGVCSSMLLPLATLPDLPSTDAEATALGTATRGTQLVILHVFVCKIGDISAFTGGKLFGRHKLAPSISPGKTWEGFGFAVAGASLAALIVGWCLSALGLAPVFTQWWSYLLWGLALGPLGVLGDLVESCLKRDAGVKDSSTVVPGFGGFLDVFDAVIFSAPAAYGLALLLP